MVMTDVDARILQEPSFAGVSRIAKPDFFTPHDEAPMGYWRKPDGFIVLAQYGENGTERKLDRGFERLGARYGSYASAGTRSWNPSADPLYPLVERGGLREMTAAQIVSLGWHRAPDRAAKPSHRAVEALIQREMQQRGVGRDEARLLVLPQLEGMALDDFTCAACPGRVFPTEAASLAHESVMHKDAVQSRSIGQAVAQAQNGAQAQSAGSDALLSIIAQQGEQLVAMQAQLAALTAKPAAKAAPKPAAPAAE